ncbi:uncharacterized protein LOC115888688 isoform X9 [Sitophilus oryzae]|uniref:Uncharacterized protein LOC115888688 isoform X9 n=1 Tax=Sitophilus oryzae TaxID=7048 RepID=A0A6J2YLR4_SITOR|nr:uncharacterized protein LOC115888688 isoform X9 [Sitophilus oryzae]
MADTVKKSRIVSEEEQDLEEALLEEFNIRLKSCMSNDDLQKTTDPPEPDGTTYENIHSPQKFTKAEIKSTEAFLRGEIQHENYYDEPRSLLTNGTKQNGHHSMSAVETDEEIYENIPEKTELDQTYVPMVELELSHSEKHSENVEYEPMGGNLTSSNLYESVELKPEIPNAKRQTPTLNLPTTSFTDCSEQKSPDTDLKSSVKDRMLLSCDDTSTLLFTQTVTSPMLTPSEENIDFLKGFRRENTNSDSTSASNVSPPKEQEEKTSPDVSEQLDDEKVHSSENYYENTAFYKNTTPENMYENLELAGKVTASDLEPEENIYEHLEDMESDETNTKEENIYQNIEETLESENEKKDLRSCDTEDGSLEEFIRYEKEVSESFLVSKKSPEKVADVLPEEVLDIVTDSKVNEDNLKEPENTPEQCNLRFEHQKTENSESITCQTITTEEKLSSETYKELIYHQKCETNSNYYEKYNEVVTKSTKNEVISNREKDTETVPAEIVKNLKSQFQNRGVEVVGIVKKDSKAELKGAKIINQIKNKFEVGNDNGDEKKSDDSTEYSETIVESSGDGERSIKKKKVKKTRKEEKENISVKSSFSKFDALQKKNVFHVRSSDSTKAQEKFSNGVQLELFTNCKACGKQVFQMEQIKAERALWHKNCFRCTECSKQLTVDTYESNEGSLYCKPHFKALFAPKVVEDEAPPRPRKHELIIRENQPVELPPDVVRASDKPDLGLEELQSLNVKERFQVFENYQSQQVESSDVERGGTPVKRSPSILSKLAKFQKHGMDVGVSNEALDGIPIEESSSEEEVEDDDVPDGEDPDLVRAKKVQKEKPFHFTGMSDVKKKWEHGDHTREERREETKQEIQNIRNRLFLGKQEKMKEAYQQAIMESESSANLRKNLTETIEVCDTKSIKERFEKGEVANEKTKENRGDDEEEVYESEISKKSRSLFLELDASASKPPQLSPVTPPKLEVKKAREAYLAKSSNEDTVKSTEQIEEVEVRTADIQERFKFFETYKEPEQERKKFRITPPRDPSQVKTETPEREIYRDPDVVRSEEYIDDSKIAKESHTASKMLNKFRQMEENLSREPEQAAGPKPLKRFTPPPEPTKQESHSEEESSEYEEEEEEEVDYAGKLPEDIVEAQKAARAKQLRAKFEKWEANEIKKEQQNSVNVLEENGEEQSQIESTRVLRARFESMKQSSSTESRGQRIKPNRFVDMTVTMTETCQSCSGKVYPLEKISIHGNIYHKNCFKCMECSCVLRMDSYSYNQGLLYCTPHFKRLFITKGNYDSAFGLDQHKEKWQNNVNNMTVA